MTEPQPILRSLPNELLRAARLTLVVAVVTGLIYPLVITGISQVVFHDQANGSQIVKNGQLVGSRLIGQNFTDPRYFFGRPSATVNQNDATKSDPYNAANSAGSNLAPSNKILIDRVAAQLTQVNHVAMARHLDPAKIRALVERYVQGRSLGIFGEPRVNVLALNMALDNGEAG
jgi:K+-transporting ATPase ATPase C chain